MYHHATFQFCLSQLVGLGFALVLQKIGYMPETPSWMYGSAVFAGIVGVVSSIISVLVFRAPWWWWGINLIFPSTVAIALTVGGSPWLYLGGFVALLIVYWNVGGSRVPLYLTNNKTSEKLISLLPVEQESRVVDLGSGLGATLALLAKQRPDAHFLGVENAPVPFLISRLRLWLWHLPNLQFQYNSIWTINLEPYDVVYCFLSPAPMARLFEKARQEMRPGTLFISNSFRVPDTPPDKTVFVEDRRRTHLLLWHM